MTHREVTRWAVAGRIRGGLALVAAVLTGSAALAHTDAPALHSASIQVDTSGFVYVVNPDADSVTRLGPLASGTQNRLWEVPVGDYPRTLTLAGGSIYTANQNDDSVSRVDASDGSAQGSVGLGFGCAPYGISANPDGDRLYVSCQGTQDVVVLDAALAVVARIALDWPMPRAVLVSGDDTRVYVSHVLTVEPNHDARVSEIDAPANTLTSRRSLSIPADRTTCETQNSGQGVTNLLNSLALTPPGSPPEVANQLWVGGTLQNNLTKGLFRRWAGFNGRPELALFDLPCPEDDGVSCLFESFPRGDGTAEVKRNVYKTSFHDVTRFVIWKIDLDTGAVVGKLDVDEANHASDIALGADGTTAYAVDHMFNSFHIFSTRRGQGTNPATLFAPVARYGPFGLDPSAPCDADALGSVASEAPHRLTPQAQISPIDGGDPVRVGAGTPIVATPVNTGVDFDTRKYHETCVAGVCVAEMRAVPDAVGTAPIGVALSPDGCVAYVHNYLGRNVVAYSARPDVDRSACGTYDPVIGFRCSSNLAQGCERSNDCSGGTGFCNHPGGPVCDVDADCETEPCVKDNNCVPLVGSDPVRTTALVTTDVPAEILDGKILFNTAARDASTPNGVGLGLPAPLFNDVRRGCGFDITRECKSSLNCSFCAGADLGTNPPRCASDGECGGARCVLDAFFCTNDHTVACTSDDDCAPDGSCLSSGCNQVASLPGEVVSTSHDASYVTCTACHADFGGQDGRTWDFSQFGASLRNTMDLRGRAQAAPGTCAPALSGDPGRVGSTCHFDAECGKTCLGGARDAEACVTTDADPLVPSPLDQGCPGGVCRDSGPGACVGNPSMTPPHLHGEDAARFFNPMITVHWNGDRMEVEGFEFTYRSLLGAADCDGLEHDPDKCLGGLFPRSHEISTAVVPPDGSYEGDLRSTLRNVMVPETKVLGTAADPVMLNATVRLTHMADFVYSLTAFPRNPFLGDGGAALSEAARRGRLIFNDGTTKCASCHNGPAPANQLFTDKRPNPGFDADEPPGAASNNPYVRHVVGTANLVDVPDPEFVARQNGSFQKGVLPIPGARDELLDYVTPSLNDVWNTAPFLHDGVAPTLLDVLRSCDTTVTDCNRPGLGRNVDDLHGVTSVLTPQQLNDLVEFQKAPHNPVGATAAVVKAGGLALTQISVSLGKKPGRGSFKVQGTASPGAFPVDPAAEGLSFSLAVPGGEHMVIYEITAPPGTVKGNKKGTSFKYKAKNPTNALGAIAITLKRLQSGDLKVIVKGKKADLELLQAALTGTAPAVTVAVVAGETQFVRSRVLATKKKGTKLVLPKTRS